MKPCPANNSIFLFIVILLFSRVHNIITISHSTNSTMSVGTIPAKLILQLTTAFREGGLRDRSNTFYYKDHLHKCHVPVLALAGDQDLICPPVAVEGTFIVFMWNITTFSILLILI